MALTDQQQQEILEVIKANTEGPYLTLTFDKDSNLIVSDHSRESKLTFNKSCVLPYITDLSHVVVEISNNATVEFPNVTSMNSLRIYTGSSVSAPELTKLGTSQIYYGLVLKNPKSVYLPKLTFVIAMDIEGDNINTLNIEECLYLAVKSFQIIFKNLTQIHRELRISLDSTVIFLEPLKYIGDINCYRNVVIIAPASSSEAFNRAHFAYSKPEIILVSEEE